MSASDFCPCNRHIGDMDPDGCESAYGQRFCRVHFVPQGPDDLDLALRCTSAPSAIAAFQRMGLSGAKFAAVGGGHGFVVASGPGKKQHFRVGPYEESKDLGVYVAVMRDGPCAPFLEAGLSLEPGVSEPVHTMADLVDYLRRQLGGESHTYRPTITAGQLMDKLAAVDQNTQVTVEHPEGSWWYNVESVTMPGSYSDAPGDGPLSLILHARDDYDPRQH